MIEYQDEWYTLAALSLKTEVPVTTLSRRYKQGYRGYQLISSVHKGTLRKGELSQTNKLSTAQVIEIKTALQYTTATQKTIAAKYGVNQSTISDIKHGKLWSHVTPDKPAKAAQNNKVTECNQHSGLLSWR